MLQHGAVGFRNQSGHFLSSANPARRSASRRLVHDPLNNPEEFAKLSSGSVTLSRCRRLAELHGWTA
jgi:hypothetical protein